VNSCENLEIVCASVVNSVVKLKSESKMSDRELQDNQDGGKDAPTRQKYGLSEMPSRGKSTR